MGEPIKKPSSLAKLDGCSNDFSRREKQLSGLSWLEAGTGGEEFPISGGSEASTRPSEASDCGFAQRAPDEELGNFVVVKQMVPLCTRHNQARHELSLSFHRFVGATAGGKRLGKERNLLPPASPVIDQPMNLALTNQ